MADANSTAVQDTTANTAQSGDAAGTGSVLTAPPPGDAASTNPDQASSNTDNAGTGDQGDKQTDNKDAKVEGAPEKYEFTVPEGMELDQEALAQFDPIARELNLTNEQAQKLADIYAQRMTATVQNQTKQWNDTLATWVTDMKSDREIGGEQFDTSVRHAQSAITKFGTPELKSALDTYGMGNHPELVRVFARIGKAMAEDTFVRPDNSGAQNDPAKKMFPGMK
jgi:hypothetical protein